jgi:ABC-type dipeptide/oligopeptide/nickel transport system permease component
VEALRNQMGAQRPLHIQYLKFISKAAQDSGAPSGSKHLVINDIKDNIGLRWR